MRIPSRSVAWFVAAILTLVLCADALSQGRKQHGLVLTGSLTAVKPVLNNRTPKPLFKYELQVLLQLRNDSNNRLIVFNPTLPGMEKRVGFMFNLSESEDSSFNFKPGPWIVTGPPYSPPSNWNPYPEIARSLGFFFQLDLAQNISMLRTSNDFVVLEPGAYHEFAEVITVEDGFKLEIKPGQSLREIESNTPIAEDPAFKLQYHLSMKKRHPNDGLLKALQERWKSFGYFLVDDNGDFTITSDMILNRSGS